MYSARGKEKKRGGERTVTDYNEEGKITLSKKEGCPRLRPLQGRGEEASARKTLYGDS